MKEETDKRGVTGIGFLKYSYAVSAKTQSDPCISIHKLRNNALLACLLLCSTRYKNQSNPSDTMIDLLALNFPLLLSPPSLIPKRPRLKVIADKEIRIRKLESVGYRPQVPP